MLTPMKSSTRNLHELFDRAAATQRLLERTFADMTLSLSQARALIFLLDAGDDGLAPSHISALMVQDPASITGLVSRLEARGYVESIRDEVDGRRRLIRLTADGYGVASMAKQRFETFALFQHGDIEGMIENAGGNREIRMEALGRIKRDG